MFCPQCGTESPADLKFCRTCGTNLRVIGKAVTLSEAIARSDSVPSKIKDLVSNLKIEKVSDEVARAMEKMKLEIGHTVEDHREWHLDHIKPLGGKRKEKTTEQRREKHLTQGFVTMFGGIGFALFLYFLAPALIGKFPHPIISGRPIDIDSLLPIAWILGLMPTFTGLGHIIAGLAIRVKGRASQEDIPQVEPAERSPLNIDERPAASVEPRAFRNPQQPTSVTDRTTNLLEGRERSQT
jgi:hypothetical protein